MTRNRTLSRSQTSTSSLGRRLTTILLKHSLSRGSAVIDGTGSVKTPRTGSILSEFNALDEHEYEETRQLMSNLMNELQIEKDFISFNEVFLDQDDVIGCLLRIFNEYAEEMYGTKRITRERMFELLEHSEISDNQYTSVGFTDDWNGLRRDLIKKKFYERKIKTLDFCGFIQFIDRIKNRLHTSKDEIFRRIIGPQIYNDVIKLKEIRDQSRLGLLPSMNTLIEQYNEMQMKINDRSITKKKKKKRKKKSPTQSKTRPPVKSSSSKRRRKNGKRSKSRKKDRPTDPIPIKQPPEVLPHPSDIKDQLRVLSKDVAKLKTFHIFEPWIKRDELDKDLMNKLFELFNLSSEQFQSGLIRQNVLIRWLRASHVISNPYSINIIEGVLASILARNIDANVYKAGTETFEWMGFMDCIRVLAREIYLSLNDFVKKMLMADEFSFQKWRIETEQILEVGTNKSSARPWDAKKVLAAVLIMRDVVEESRKLHLTDDERKRLRSLYKEFATFAYRRQSSHLEARLTNSVLSNWMRECRIFDEKYTVNELDKDFISILGDFTLNGVYPQGTRDVDFDGFLMLMQTIAAHKHVRADDFVQMIFAGPRSPLQKTVEFNEHMDRTKIQTSQGGERKEY